MVGRGRIRLLPVPGQLAAELHQLGHWPGAVGEGGPAVCQQVDPQLLGEPASADPVLLAAVEHLASLRLPGTVEQWHCQVLALEGGENLAAEQQVDPKLL